MRQVLQNNVPMGDNRAKINDNFEELYDDVGLLAPKVEELFNAMGEGAGYHNSIYRGKHLGASVSSEQIDNIRNSTFDDLFIGDYWEINGIKWRIAAFDYYRGCGDVETTQQCLIPHVTIVPDTVIGENKQMNTSNVTTGAYVGSAMRGGGSGLAGGNLNEAKGIINAAFPGLVMVHRKYLNNAMTSGYPSGGAYMDSDVELMNEHMVYGAKINAPGNSLGATVPTVATFEKSQLPLFAHRHDLIRAQNQNPWQNYWLRDPTSATAFASVSNAGRASNGAASAANGVRPAFSIA